MGQSQSTRSKTPGHRRALLIDLQKEGEDAATKSQLTDSSIPLEDKSNHHLSMSATDTLDDRVLLHCGSYIAQQVRNAKEHPIPTVTITGKT